jgi:hypothetical protein
MAAAFVQSAATWNTTAGNKAASLTPAVGGLLVVVAGASGTAAGSYGTITDDQGGTYTRVIESTRTTSGYEAIYIRDQLVTSAVLHTVTVSQPGGDTGGGLAVAEFSGCTNVGSAAAGAKGGQSNQASGTTPSITLDASASSTNPVVAAISMTGNPGTVTAPSGFTQRQSVSYNTPATALRPYTRDSGFSGSTLTWGSTANQSFGDVAVEIIPSSGPQTILAGRAVDTQTARPITPKKTYHLGQAIETDSAQAITPRQPTVVAVGQATEVDSAQAVGHKKTAHLGQATETDAAQAIDIAARGRVSFVEVDIPNAPVQVGQATETDTASAVTHKKTAHVGQASETDTAQAIGHEKVAHVGQASETDAAQTISHKKTAHVGQATEVDEAQAIAASTAGLTVVPVGQATEADSAQAITPRKTVQVGQATESDVAQAITGAKTAHVGQATETDEAQPITPASAIIVAVGQATETDTARPITIPTKQTVVVGEATEREFAFPIEAHTQRRHEGFEVWAARDKRNVRRRSPW